MGDAIFDLEALLRSRKSRRKGTGENYNSRSKYTAGMEGSRYEKPHYWFWWRFDCYFSSRMQRELANIMLKNYSNHPWVLQRHSKHFYSEEVYEDSSVDKPKFRWHFRNFSGDPIAHSQTASYEEETDSEKKDVKKTTVEPKQANAAGDAAENPFDLIFGLPESAENIPYPGTPGTTTRECSHRERRSRRRHRRHRQEDSNA